jgi:hypothetical protein
MYIQWSPHVGFTGVKAGMSVMAKKAGELKMRNDNGLRSTRLQSIGWMDGWMDGWMYPAACQFL